MPSPARPALPPTTIPFWWPGGGCSASAKALRWSACFTLYLVSRGWSHAGLGLACFGAGFVIVRLVCGNLPDRLGGVPVAVVSLAVEACGQ
jgi:hypothetical protein